MGTSVVENVPAFLGGGVINNYNFCKISNNLLLIHDINIHPCTL